MSKTHSRRSCFPHIHKPLFFFKTILLSLVPLGTANAFSTNHLKQKRRWLRNPPSTRGSGLAQPRCSQEKTDDMPHTNCPNSSGAWSQQACGRGFAASLSWKTPGESLGSASLGWTGRGGPFLRKQMTGRDPPRCLPDHEPSDSRSPLIKIPRVHS